MTEATTSLPAQLAAQGAAAADGRSADYALKGAWFTLWVMVIMILVANVDRQMLVLGAAPLSAALGLTDSQLGVAQGLPFAIFTVLAVYPIAWAADRFDRRLVFGLCVLIWSLGTAACGLAQNFGELFLAAVAIAAGEAGLTPVGIAFVPELFKGRKRLLANSVFYVFGFGGVAGGLMLGGAAMGLAGQLRGALPSSLQVFEAWRLAFFLVALPTPIFLALIGFSRLGRRARAPVSTPNPVRRPELWPFVRRHWPAMIAIFGGGGCYTLGVGGYFFWLPVAATRMFGTTPAENGAYMGGATAIGLIVGVSIGTLVVRRMIPRLGPGASIRFFWTALIAGLPIFLVFPFVGAAWHLFVLYGLVMLIFTAVGCAVPAIMQDMAPADLRGRVAAIGGIVNGVLSGFAPVLVGWLSPLLGSNPRMLLVAMGVNAIPLWILAALCFRAAESPFIALTRECTAVDAIPETHQ